MVKRKWVVSQGTHLAWRTILGSIPLAGSLAAGIFEAVFRTTEEEQLKEQMVDMEKKIPGVAVVTQESYDSLEEKDPHTFYVVRRTDPSDEEKH